MTVSFDATTISFGARVRMGDKRSRRSTSEIENQPEAALDRDHRRGRKSSLAIAQSRTIHSEQLRHVGDRVAREAGCGLWNEHVSRRIGKPEIRRHGGNDNRADATTVESVRLENDDRP